LRPDLLRLSSFVTRLVIFINNPPFVFVSEGLGGVFVGLGQDLRIFSCGSEVSEVSGGEWR
jgi:hypothetical protein